MKNIVYSFILSLFICFVAQGYATKTQNELSDNVVRLHIIANSNTPEDQKLKYKVRDNIIKNVSISDENFLTQCKQIANQTIINDKYSAVVEYGNYYFPVKKYKNITLPCGNYNAVRVILGEGRGENWWCVLYPPMCLENNNVTMDKYSIEQLKRLLSSDSYDLITEKNSKVQIKFKTIEIINELMNLIDNL